MTSDPKKERLACIDDFMIEEILAMSDAEVLSEVPDAEIEEAQRRLDEAKLAVGKRRFEAIKKQLENEKVAGGVVSFDKAKARAELRRMIANDSKLAGKLTMAARNLDGDVDDDAEGILEDLAELDSEVDRPDKKQ
jgi:hypothetical protein